MPQSEKVKYLVYRGKVIPLFLSDIDSLWRSLDGTIFALRDNTASVDNIDRCGVGIFSLPTSHPLTAVCSVHDELYSNPTYQLFHTRKEADQILENLIKQSDTPWFSKPFYWISRFFGAKYWENKDTNN